MDQLITIGREGPPSPRSLARSDTVGLSYRRDAPLFSPAKRRPALAGWGAQTPYPKAKQVRGESGDE